MEINPLSIRKLDDDTLIQNTRELVTEERKLTTLILHHLRELDRRRLYSKLGYSSLFAYCVQGLGYAESSAQRRIEAMRMIRELPEIEKKIQDGSLSLSVVAKAQTFFKQEAKSAHPFSTDEKKEILQTLEGLSFRQAERELLTHSTQPAVSIQEKARALPNQLTEVRFIADEALMSDLEKLKGLLAHRSPNLGWGELVRSLAEIGLEKLDPIRKAERAEKRKAAKQEAALPTSAVKTLTAQPDPEPSPNKPRSRVIHAEDKHAVWKRDQGKCVRCGSKYLLELDHRIPFAEGGANSAENLRLTCRGCNQWYAAQAFGIEKMEKHWR